MPVAVKGGCGRVDGGKLVVSVPLLLGCGLLHITLKGSSVAGDYIVVLKWRSSRGRQSVIRDRRQKGASMNFGELK